MSEPGQQEDPVLRVSKKPVIQEEVERVENHLKGKRPSLTSVDARNTARDIVALELRLDRAKKDSAQKAEERKLAEVEKALAEQRAMTDTLTGLPNRRWFDGELERRTGDALRHNRSLWVIAMDIDFFKLINDNYGHAIGDEVLRTIKHLPSRIEEPVARIGGEEFIQIVDGEPSIKGLAKLLDSRSKQFTRLTNEILSQANILPGKDPTDAPQRATLSFGITKYVPGESPQALLQRADTALYRAKETGRDRGIIAEPNDQGQITFTKITS